MLTAPAPTVLIIAGAVIPIFHPYSILSHTIIMTLSLLYLIREAFGWPQSNLNLRFIPPPNDLPVSLSSLPRFLLSPNLHQSNSHDKLSPALLIDLSYKPIDRTYLTNEMT